ncbi:MAG: hypothetical protein Q9174_003936 [Haloplaca sp. 1 TL-2023]
MSVLNATSIYPADTFTAVSYWAATIKNNTQLMNILFGGTEDNSQQIDVKDLPVEAKNSTTPRLAAALDLVLSDIPTFIAFAVDGDLFTDPSPLVLTRGYAPNLNIGLNTFATGKLMEKAGIFAKPGDIVDTLSTEACELTKGTYCVLGNGNVRYWSRATHRQYELAIKSANPVIALQNLIMFVVDYAWAEPEFLFDGSYNCTLSGRAGQQIVVADATKPSGLDLSCVGQVPIYLDCGKPCPEGAVFVGGKCPFGNYVPC